MTHPALPGDIDAALRDLVAEVGLLLGSSLVGAFLEGSFAWDNPVATSDLDVRIVVDEQPSEAVRMAVGAARDRIQERLGREVGIGFDRLDDLIRVGAVRFQRSRWLVGEDVRARVPLKPVDAFVRDSMLNAVDLVVSVRADRGRDAAAPEFRGYDTRTVLHGGRWVPSSKRLVSVVTAIATARIAERARMVVVTKREVPELYARHIGDEWSGLVAGSYESCRMKASYLLPEDAAGRTDLTALCDRATAFETMFLDETMPRLRAMAASDVERERIAGEKRLAAIGQPPVTKSS